MQQQAGLSQANPERWEWPTCLNKRLYIIIISQQANIIYLKNKHERTARKLHKKKLLLATLLYYFYGGVGSTKWIGWIFLVREKEWTASINSFRVDRASTRLLLHMWSTHSMSAYPQKMTIILIINKAHKQGTIWYDQSLHNNFQKNKFGQLMCLVRLAWGTRKRKSK